jgi:MFS family permease
MPTLAARRMLAIGGGYTQPTIRFRVSKMKLTPPEIRAVIALAVGMFCVQVDFFALSLALPRMAVDLNETTTNMQWVLSAYMIAVRAAMIPGGRLGDLRGHRRIVVAGLAVFGGASLICGLSFSYGLLIGFRAVQGLGAAALFTVSVAAISNAVASDHPAAAIGLSTESRISEPHSGRSSADF